MTPEDKLAFLASFGNAFEINCQAESPSNSTEGLSTIVEKQPIEEYLLKTEKLRLPEKKTLQKSLSLTGMRSATIDGGELYSYNKNELYNSYSKNEQEPTNEEEVSYLMPYSHKSGVRDVLPSLTLQQLYRNRSFSMPFIKPSDEEKMMFESSNEPVDDANIESVNKDSTSPTELSMTQNQI